MIICPILKSTKKCYNTRKRCSTAVITSSPYNELESDLNENEEKLEREKKRLQKISEVKRNHTTPSAKGESSSSNAAKEKSKLLLSQDMTRPQQQESTSESELRDNDDDPECIFCRESYLCSHKDDGRIECSTCTKWAHIACTGVDENDADFYICYCCV